MSAKEENAKIGCIAGLLSLLIQFPIFMVLLFGILQACDAPTWLWVIYWIYVPVVVILGLFRLLIDSIAKAHE